MAELRVAATSVVGRAARSRPAQALRSWQLSSSPDRDGEQGQGLAEYALILSGVAIVAVASLIFLGETIMELFWDPIDAEFGRILTDVLGIGADPPPG